MPTKRKGLTGPKRRAAPIAKAAAKAKGKAAPSASRKAASQAKAQLTAEAPRRFAPPTMYGILHPGVELRSEPEFRDAPDGWTQAQARTLAAAAGLKLTDDHWEVIRVLQGCYKDELAPRLRLLRDALEARFAAKGGIKYLFEILPGGPIAQGCTLAGVKPPAGARDTSFGSVA